MSEPTAPEPSARRQLAAALTGALPAWQVTGYPHMPDRITRPTVMVWTDRIEPAEQIGRDRLIVTLTLWLLTGTTAPGEADDELDAMLLEVLDVLLPLQWLDWTGAERGVLQDTYHGYQVTARAVLKIGD